MLARLGVYYASKPSPLTNLSAMEFNEAFDALAGLGGEISVADMQAFTDFAMRISYPPNPMRQLDNSLVGIEIDGERLYNNGVVRVQTGSLEVSAQCHPIDPAAGIFGTRGLERHGPAIQRLVRHQHNVSAHHRSGPG